MKTRYIAWMMTVCVALTLLSGCSIEVAGSAALTEPIEADTSIHFDGDTVAITGSGAALDKGEIVISQAGSYKIYGTCDFSRVIVKADETADVTIILAGLTLTNPEDEAIYFKTCRSATVILEEDTENILTSGTEPLPDEETTTAVYTAEEERAEEDTPSGAALRALCAMTIEGQGSLTVKGYINNGIAADGGLTVTGGKYDVTAANDGLKSDGNVTISGGTFIVNADHDGISAGIALDISGGTFDVTTGVGAESAEMKVSDSLFMGGGGMGGGRNRQASTEASTETSSEAAAEPAETNTEEPTATAASTEAESAAASQETTQETTQKTSASREMPMPGGMPGFDDMMDTYDADLLASDSYKGLKAAESITISGGAFLLDCQDDAIHSDGTVTISGGSLLLLSGDDGIRGETELRISGGDIDIPYCYEGLEATSILITGGYTNIVATDDGMNAGGGMFMMGGGPSREASSEASAEAETDTADTAEADAASAEAMDTVSAGQTGTEDTNPIVRITGGTVIVDSGGDGLDSNGSMYIEGGVVFVSGPSTNWDSPIDCGEGTNEFVITGGHFMAAGYSAMVETPEESADSQASIFYAQSEYAPDNAVVTLKDATGRVLAEYAFAHSFNCVMISTPEMAQGETYTLTIDGLDTVIEMTTAVYSNRGGSGEMGGMGPGGRR